MTYLKTFLRFSLFAALLFPSSGECTDCHECLERKRLFCSAECQLVPKEQSLNCQNDCIREYCAHRCAAGHPDLPKSFLKETGDKNCEPCLDKEFNLCSVECKTGTERMLALCKLDCAEQRCASLCH